MPEHALAPYWCQLCDIVTSKLVKNKKYSSSNLLLVEPHKEADIDSGVTVPKDGCPPAPKRATVQGK